jgi:hypothetical protein
MVNIVTDLLKTLLGGGSVTRSNTRATQQYGGSVFFVSAHGPLLCNAHGDVTPEWEAITREPQQIRMQQKSSCVFCAWSVPRGYKSQIVQSREYGNGN